MLGRFEEAHRAYIAFYERCGAPCDWMREALERGWAEGGWEGSVRAWLEVATNIEGFSPWLIADVYAIDRRDGRGLRLAGARLPRARPPDDRPEGTPRLRPPPLRPPLRRPAPPHRVPGGVTLQE